MTLRLDVILLCVALAARAQTDLLRSGRLRQSAKFKLVDTVRMEVAEVNGKELFARPGQQFDQMNPRSVCERWRHGRRPVRHVCQRSVRGR